MDAFGGGSYVELDHRIIHATFSGRNHLILFNEGYTQFTSVRRDDNEIIKGGLV
jgi:hypothetical protein